MYGFVTSCDEHWQFIVAMASEILPWANVLALPPPLILLINGSSEASDDRFEDKRERELLALDEILILAAGDGAGAGTESGAGAEEDEAGGESGLVAAAKGAACSGLGAKVTERNVD